jgi:hypothetical protein
MLPSVDFTSLFQYSPRGGSRISQQSRDVTGAVKGGRIVQFRNIIQEMIDKNLENIQPFLNQNVTLVPAPRSSLIRDTDLWPALEIARVLASMDLGNIIPCLTRTRAIKKSASCRGADERPSIQEQYDSMDVANAMPRQNITLVDDVLSLGRTTIAGASRLHDRFPGATIRVFGLILTRSFVDDVESIRKFEIGKISYNIGTGKCRREP